MFKKRLIETMIMKTKRYILPPNAGPPMLRLLVLPLHLQITGEKEEKPSC